MNKRPKNIEDLTNIIIKFRDSRDWRQFHNAKDVAISLTLEASELLELFQWKNKEEVDKYVTTNKKEIGEELADVFYWILLMSYDLRIDLTDALEKKLQENAKKYPVDKAKGTAKKYRELI